MFDQLLTVVAVLGGLLAVTASILTFTRNARLKRIETYLRELMGSSPSSRAGILEPLHRSLVAELVARQTIPPLRLVWPYMFFLGLAVVAGQIGYLTLNYLWTMPTPDYAGYVSAVQFGDPMSFSSGILLLYLLPANAGYLERTLVHRAEMAHNYYNGRSICLINVLGDTFQHRGRAWNSVRPTLPSALFRFGPGLLALSSGFAVGGAFASNQLNNGQESTPDSVLTVTAYTALAIAIAGAVSLSWLRKLSLRASQFKLPQEYPSVDRK